MNENRLLDEWLQTKRKDAYFRLVQPGNLEYEFNGPQFGHPSNYALVAFECEPADELIFTSTAEWPARLRDWPPSVRGGYPVLLEKAIRLAVVEGLLGGVGYPHRGCAFTLVRVAYDDVMSSEAAFYFATRRAMNVLIADHKWSREKARVEPEER